MSAELPRYVVMNRNGYVIQNDDDGNPMRDEAVAHSRAAWCDQIGTDAAPHHVYTLTRVPKPVPPRPSVRVAGDIVEYDIDRALYSLNGTRFAKASAVIKRMHTAPDDESVTALLALPEQTRVWERDHGGAA